MKTMNKLMMILAFCVLLTLLAGCQKATPTPVSQTSCATDDDCACGTHIDTGDCFIGNKAFVNVEKQCPDFCTGIAAMFEIRCVDNNCKQVRKETPAPQDECTSDSDCVPEQCCHPTTCIPAEQKGVCNLACTAVCLPGTIDCGGFCACDNGKCTAQLNDL
jgi:hypothetical protein